MDEMDEMVYHMNGKRYRKIGRNEIIKEGAMQSWDGSGLLPITNTMEETIGNIPANFSRERDFYNPID